ncbi:MAG: universal stress protein [Salibacteraceae bacterium]
MNILKSILLATDFSKSSEHVLENAIDIAKIFESSITPIYVLPKEIEDEMAKALLKEFALNQLNLINDKIKAAGISTEEPILEQGNFSDKVVKAANKTKANMIVIGAGEKIEDNIFVLGSNAEKIIKKCSKPVFVVKNGNQFSIKKILCPVDFSGESKRALKNAITMAHRFNAQLVIFSAYDASHLKSIHNSINLKEQIGFIKEAHEKEFNSFLSDFNLSDLDVVIESEQGKADIEILEAINKHNADLLIIGTTGKSGISRILMGSVTEKVIRKIPCSFITLKKEDVIVLELESKFQSIEGHYNVAEQLYNDGFYEESINEFQECLNISVMHVPSLKGLAKVYNKLNDSENETKYRDLLTQVLDKMYNEKIEAEIRQFKSV